MAKESAKQIQKPAPSKGVSKAPTSAQKEQIGVIRAQFYYDQYYFLAFMSFCLLMIAGACAMWGYYERTLQNVPNQGIPSKVALKDGAGNVAVEVGDPTLKFPTTPDGRLMYPTPLSEPSLSTSALLEWGVQAVVDSYSFNFINLEQIITKSSIFYTKAGYQNYRRTLIESNIANSVDRKRYVLSVIPTAAPNILKESRTPEGFYSWLIQFPIAMVYQNVRETQRSEWIVTMAIQRVPLSESPDGVAIAALIVREGKLNL
jgi:hypothetical protein